MVFSFLKEIISSLSFENPINNINVVLYGRENGRVVSLCKYPIDEIKKYNCTGELKEMYEINKKIFISIGDVKATDIDGRSLVPLNTYKAMSVLASKIRKHFLKYSIQFMSMDDRYMENCLFGLIQSLYKFNPNFYRNWDIPMPKIKLVYDKEKYSKIVLISKAQCASRFLGDLPGNWLTPIVFTKYAKGLMKGLNNVEMKILNQDDCKKLGMNIYNSVAQGSHQPGRFLSIKYKGNKFTSTHHVALIGKGVCFDSGGISLKPSNGMKNMKMDMMGGATMLVTFYLAALHKLPINISCTIPLVENMPGGQSTKPGDVFIAMNNKSVEVENTDAEGRLILADAILYAQSKYNAKPLYIINAATLTGSMIEALGHLYCGYFSNNNDLMKLIDEAAIKTNEYMVKMPLSKTYFELMKSNVADMLNTGGKYGKSPIAATFLYQFVEERTKFVHFDIAGICMNGYPKEVYGEDASGRPVNTFYEILNSISKKFI